MAARSGNKDQADGTKTDATHKALDPSKPFHRIESPDFRPDLARPSGRTAKCRKGNPPNTNPALLNMSILFLPAIPAWTPVVPDQTRPDLGTSPDKELEGMLVKSFQTWTDFPILQWHRWYDWNFHVAPDDGYKYLRGEGNEADLGNRTPVIRGETMECEWDTGAFGKPDFALEFGPGPMFSADWAWPMAGQNIWVRGKWIYDCGHANSKNQVRTELHPCKAVATARWEGTRFKADSKVAWPSLPSGGDAVLGTDTFFIPAIQFMFFSSRFGGYIDNGNINDRVYRFIVDLPKILPDVIPNAPIFEDQKATKTLSIPKLVWSFDQKSFKNFSKLDKGSFGVLEPVVIPIDPHDGTPPQQAIIEIPLTSLPDGAHTDAYGVIISLGWFHADRREERAIVKCTVTIDSIEVVDQKNGNWVLKVGVNGRWARIPLSVKHGKKTLNFSFAPIPLSLNDPPGGGIVMVNTHGKDIHKVGEFLKNNGAIRLVRFPDVSPGVSSALSNTPVKWEDHVESTDDNIARAINKGILQTGPALGTLVMTFNDVNLPLGIADVSANVRSVSSDPNVTRLQARSIDEFGTLAELVESELVQVSGGAPFPAIDYVLNCHVDVEPQHP